MKKKNGKVKSENGKLREQKHGRDAACSVRERYNKGDATRSLPTPPRSLGSEGGLTRLFNKACTAYGLLSDGDRILLALSGGKDSLVMAQLMAERARIFKPSIQVEAVHVVMDNVPYQTDIAHMQEFCNGLGIPLHILDT